LNLYFIDTSALAKRYIPEIGSTWVESLIEPGAGNIAIISWLTITELFAVLARRRRDGSLAPATVIYVQATFLAHVNKEYLCVSVDNKLLMEVRLLADKYTLRSLDSIQLASAVEAAALLNDPIMFVSADTNLLLATVQEGFAVDNPLDHP
jgi:hypothetical protein